MRNLLKNITKTALSVLIACSVLMLNWGTFRHCTEGSMEDNCCHVTKTVKQCCIKHLKLTLNERISGHCGCTVNETQQTADLYHDLKNSNSNLTSRTIQYSSPAETGFHPELIGNITGNYSPPQKYSTDTYLTNSILRI
ncbi:MAG TPA: hypothetical protein PKE39_10275 [Ignavibacteria bacterium]|nr:hypothetical protein [Ignavibacteria bacterium]HMQ99398.1 hypothetical protein [Ignavibacteria bacterium]